MVNERVLFIYNKDNVDVRIKRRRDGEYIAHVLAMKLNKGIKRVSESGKRVTLHSVISAIRIDPMYIINIIIKQSNLVSYRDMVNDNDATVALKYTYKGISGLGEDGTSIQRNYRYVDPSHAGILDLDASSASDPGMSGIMCPMGQMYENASCFTQYKEPDFWDEKYRPYQYAWKQELNPEVIQPIVYDPNRTVPGFDYKALRDMVVEQSLQIDRIKCPVYNIYDASIDLSGTAKRIEEEQKVEEAKETRSLFTITKDISEGEIDNG